MSTRSQIAIESRPGTLYPIRIYKHCDGYPDGVMPTLLPFAQAFAADRGSDPSYWIAQCLRRFALRDLEKYRKGLLDNPATAEYSNPWNSFLSWGVDSVWHGDIEYAYIVSPAGAVKVIDIEAMPDRLPAESLPPGRVIEWNPED